MNQLAGAILGLIFMSLAVGSYFAPTIVAGLRQHHQLGPSAVINFFLGWTLIGWVVAMAMAASPTTPKPLPAWPPATRTGSQYGTDGQYRTDTMPAPPVRSYGELQERSA